MAVSTSSFVIEITAHNDDENVSKFSMKKISPLIAVKALFWAPDDVLDLQLKKELGH